MNFQTAQRHPYALFYEKKSRVYFYTPEMPARHGLPEVIFRDFPEQGGNGHVGPGRRGHNEYYVREAGRLLRAERSAAGGHMTEKELRRLSRAELLEMLLAQTEENRQLKRELQEAREALTDRKIAIEESGSMAEAALRLNGVFEAADQAVRQYLENMERVMRERRGES